MELEIVQTLRYIVLSVWMDPVQYSSRICITGLFCTHFTFKELLTLAITNIFIVHWCPVHSMQLSTESAAFVCTTVWFVRKKSVLELACSSPEALDSPSRGWGIKQSMGRVRGVLLDVDSVSSGCPPWQEDTLGLFSLNCPSCFGMCWTKYMNGCILIYLITLKRNIHLLLLIQIWVMGTAAWAGRPRPPSPPVSSPSPSE